MIRLLISAAISLAANAVGLLVASVVLDDNMSVPASGFLLAVVIFTAVEMIALPFFRQMAIQQARALAGGTALVATFVGLVVTVVVTDVEIEGVSTWLLATGIVWVASLVAAFILPAVFIKNRVQDRRR